MQLGSLVLAHAFEIVFFCCVGSFRDWGSRDVGGKMQSPSAAHYMAALFFNAAKTPLI